MLVRERGGGRGVESSQRAREGKAGHQVMEPVSWSSRWGESTKYKKRKEKRSFLLSSSLSLQKPNRQPPLKLSHSFYISRDPPSPSFFSFLFLSWLSLFPNTNLHSLTFLTSSQTQLHRQTTLFKKKIKKRTTLVFGFSLKNYYIKTCHNQRNPPLEEIWTSAH
jgi:hypothetical protein